MVKKQNHHLQYWFKRRRYGYGWVPVTWQGWTCVICYLAYVALQIVLLKLETDSNRGTDLFLFFMALILATAAVIVITYLKAPFPKWRWGRKPTDNKHEDF